MLATILFLLSAVVTRGDRSPATTSVADDAFVRMDYPGAIASCEEVLHQDPHNTAVLWRLARAYVCYGEPFDDARRSDLCKKAEKYARECIALDPAVPEGHTWLAGALGYLALDADMKHQTDLSYEILAETDKALALNPRDDAALSIRGSLFRALGNVSWFQRRLAGIFFGGIPDGGYPEAEESLKKAIAIAPDVMRHYYELGVLYIDMGRIADARTALEKVLTLPVRVAIDIPRRQKAAEMLKTLENK